MPQQLKFFVKANGEPRFHAKREGFRSFDQAKEAKAEEAKAAEEAQEESPEEAGWPFELPEGDEANLDWLCGEEYGFSTGDLRNFPFIFGFLYEAHTFMQRLEDG